MSRAETPRLSPAHISILKKRNQSFSLMKAGSHSNKLGRTSFNERVKVAAESAAAVGSVSDATPAVSDALSPEAELVFKAANVDVKKRSFVKDTSFTEPANLHDQETGFALHQNLSMVLANLQ